MTQPIAISTFNVAVLYGHFVIRDYWCDAGDDGESLKDAFVHTVAASTYQFTALASSDVQLTFRIWDTDPPRDSGVWDGCRDLALHCPTGELLVEQITAGAAAQITVPAGAGVYGLRTYWTSSATPMTMAAAGRTDGEPSGQPLLEPEQPSDRARFLIDAWRQGPLPPADDDDDFYGDLWS
ncbi:hypothetical protein MRQ36_27985 [Micromonospora sp. R77]|uniref:hypothetical protein n=1 Tax=Micromonospora sp. R77 TaxID=2925836 RepID=UPI001F60F401|nr:hypothetical protein [Micromonospora sp. R77]MCI4066182.1 hypothetical protein [Micromonospora sp. R77]